MDQEILANVLQEILEELKFQSAVRNVSSSGKSTDESIAMEQVARRLNRLGGSSDDLDKELLKLGYSSKGLNQSQIDQLKSAHEYNKQIQTQNEALKNGTIALKEFGKSLLNSERNFSKYGSALEGITNAAGKFISVLGTAGKILGPMVESLGKLGKLYLEQADRLLKANDSLAQFGTAGSFTTKELMQMAHGAGITSKNMELFTKPLSSLGPALINLGKNTGDSVKAFADLTKISNKQREEFQRLGISQEQLIQTQADYVALQAMSGRNIKNEVQDRVALQKASLNYQDTLLELATLTGQDAESIKKKQQEASRAVEWQISQIQLENKARTLEAQGRTEEAKKLREEAKARVDSLNRIAALGNETLTKGARQFLSTGTIVGEEAQALTRMGLMEDLQKLREGIQSGANVQEVTAQFQDAYNKKFGKTIDNIGFAAQLSGDIARLFGIDVKSLENFNRQRDQNFKEETKIAQDRINRAKEEGIDPAQDARAKLTTLEIEASKMLDKLTAAANPLISGLNATTIALTAFGAALGGATNLVGGRMLSGKAGLGKKAIENAEKIIPKGATGGVFEGPKEGYLAELHGKEMIVPLEELGFGKKVSELEKQPIAKTNNDLVIRGNKPFNDDILHKFTETDEDMDIFGKTLKDSENILKKFNTTLTKFNEFEEDRLDEIEERNKKIDNAQKGISGAISNAAIDIRNFAKFAIKLVSTDANSTGTGSNITNNKPTSSSSKSSLSTVGTGTGGTVTSSSGRPVTFGSGMQQPTSSTTIEDNSMSSTISRALGNIGSIFGFGSNKEKDSSENAIPSSTVQGLLDFIGKHESGNDYNILVGGKRANLTEMTVEQILQLQSQMLRMGHESTAVGKYQIINKTLREILGSSGVQLTDKFNQVTQDRLAMSLLKRRNLEGYLTKKIDADAFADQLSMEWASLPYRTGKSYYSGVGSNKSLVSRAELINSLPKAQEGGVFAGPESGYLVEMHGNEIVLPMDKIAGVTQKELSSITKSIEDIPKSDVTSVLKELQSDIKTTMTQLVQNKNDNLATGTNTNADLMNNMMFRLDQIIDQLAKSNNTQDQLLQTARV